MNKNSLWVRLAYVLSSVPIGILLLGVAGLRAQEITGRILGSVSDTSGAVVPNAQITITNQDTGAVRNTASGTDGLYNVPQLGAGTYTVAVIAPGFSPAQVKDAMVTVGTDTGVDLKLQIGTVTQSVTVTEAAPLVETTSGSIGSTVNQESIEDLPLNGRNWTDLTLLQPGVLQIKVLLGTAGVPGFNGLFYSSNGAPLRSNAVMLDGANEKTMLGFNNASITNTSLGVDGIQEYKVVTNIFSAEYGLSMGSQTTLVSKGGTNDWHGDAFDYIRNSSLDSRNYFDALDTIDANGFGTDKSLVYPGKRIPPFRRNDFGGSFGGPIKKNKTFFYAVFEGIRAQTGITITRTALPKACFVDASGVLHATVPTQIENVNSFGTCAPGAASTIAVAPIVQPFIGLFPQPNVIGYPTFNYTYPYIQPTSEEYGQIRGDHNVSAADTVFFRYTHDDNDTIPNYSNYPPFDLTQHSGSQFATLGENHVFSPTLLNTARLSFSRTRGQIGNAIDYSAPNAPPVSLVLVPGKQFGSISPGGGVTGPGANSAINSFSQNIYTISDDVFWTKGKHAFKFGTLINYFYQYPDGSISSLGSVSFASLSNFFSGVYSSISELAPSSTIGNDVRYLTFGFYAQDDYRMTSRVTWNLGLRYEVSTVPVIPNPALDYSFRYPLTDTTGDPGRMFLNSTWHNFSPRIGFAWDPFGKGKTSVRGGAGIFYDVGDWGSIGIENALSTPPRSVIYTVSNTALVPAIPLTIPLLSVYPLNTQAVRTVDYHLGNPTLLQHSLEIDQQLPWGIGLNVGYVGSRGWHLLQQEEANPVISVGTDQKGLPIYGCWNAAETAYQLATANGSCPTGFTSTGPRTNLALGQVLQVRARGDSYYNALQVSLKKRISEGLQFQLAYTLSKLIDDGQEENQTEGTENIQAPFNEYSERGPAVFDAPQNLRVNAIYHAPTIQSDKIAGKFLNGWWFSPIVSAQSGYPFSPYVSIDRELQNASQVNERVNLDPSFNAHGDIEGRVAQWFNPTEFDLQAAGHLGNAGRDILRGPGFLNVDFSIVKDTKVGFLGEAGNIEFRAELFNLLNHANFANPNSTVYSGPGGAAGGPPAGQIGSSAALAPLATAGQITSTVSSSRQIQFALKFIF